MLELAIIIFSTLCVSFFCSLSEACLLSTTHSQIAVMLQAKKSVGRIWLQFKEKIENPIAVILVVNTIGNTGGGILAGSALVKLTGSQHLFLFSFFFTTALLFLSEILPKTLGVRYRHKIAPVIAIPLNLLVKFMKPVTWMTGHFARMFFGQQGNSENHIAQEINSLASLARISGTISQYEEHLIKESFSLTEMTAGDVMIPADDLAVVSNTISQQEALIITQLAGHSRYPLIEGEDRNKVLGYINFKELSSTLHTNPQAKLEDICRPILFVRANLPASNLLKQFVDTHEHIAMVLSLEDKILGMITFEDILEEIVGEVHDEYDRLPRKALAIDPNHWIIGGGIRMDELRKTLSISAASIDNSREQLAAWLLEQLGRRPRHNDRVALGGFEFQIKRMRRGKASEIKVTRI